jgi:kynureninase
MTTDTSLAFAQSQDKNDPLRGFRSRFVIPDPNLIYMDGNSLGRLPQETLPRLEKVVQDEWGGRLVRAWGDGWFETPLRLGDKIAQLVGAAPGQVAVCDSTSTNLFKLSLAALALRPGRTKIISDEPNFPTDLYILQGAARLLGNRHTIELIPGKDSGMDLEALLAAIDENTALVLLSHVQFKSGFLYDAAAVTRACHHAGALVLWDLSHSAGAVPVELDAWDADFAVGCTYKYLNGGPGSPAYLYANRRLQEDACSPIWGWFGQRTPFAFDLDYTPAAGVGRFLAGSPPILSMQAIEPGVDLLLEAGMDALRAKSIALTTYFIGLFDELLAPLGFSLGTPRQAEQRGSHISLRHPEGYRINCALIQEMNVIPDFREPDHIRIGFAPIYTTFQDAWETTDRLRTVLREKRFLHYSEKRQAVT